MTDIFIFVFGVIATILAIGPLVYAAILDQRDEDQ